jgi:hypothetical protein
MTKGDGLPCVRCGTRDWDKRGNCKECKRERARKWYKANPEKARENNRKWYEANTERHREHTRKWRAANPEKHRESSKQWGRNNPEKRKERLRKWRKDNPDKNTAAKQRYRTKKTKAGGSYTAAEWKALCKQYNNHCCYPGCKRTDLHADHVVPVSRGGTSDISNMQPLCSRHNTSKGDGATDYRTKPGMLRWIQKSLFG